MKLKYYVTTVYNNGDEKTKSYSSLFFARKKMVRMANKKNVKEVQLMSKIF